MGVSDNAVQQTLAGTRSFDVADFAVPTGREEVWRFTPKAAFKPLFDDAPSDGQLAWETSLPAGVTLTEVSAEAAAAASPGAPIDRVAVLAAKHSGTAMRLHIPAEADLREPVVVNLTGVDAGRVVWGQLLIEVGHHASATIVLRHAGAAHYGSFTSVSVGDGASLDLVSLQEWDDEAVHAGHVSTRLGRDARMRSIVVSLGGIVRLVNTVDYAAPGGDAELLGAFFAGAGEHLEHRILVDHNQPHCRSNVVYKGALAGDKAHAVWIGDVIIRADAVGTDTYELNRNLLLTDGARADSVPNLEIQTGDVVGAGHASATGRFDDEQLFYLQARGIPSPVARRLVVRGFFADVVRRIGSDEIEAEIMRSIDGQLATLDDGADAEMIAAYETVFSELVESSVA